MKSIKYKILTCFFLCFLICACNENITQSYSDVAKYTWLVPFLLDGSSKLTGTYDPDSGILKFDYLILKINSPFESLDIVAQKEDWTTQSSDKTHRSMLKMYRYMKLN